MNYLKLTKAEQRTTKVPSQYNFYRYLLFTKPRTGNWFYGKTPQICHRFGSTHWPVLLLFTTVIF